jgi:hypothetical protein
MPVILATHEAEIRKIAVWSQLRQIVSKTLSWKNSSGGVAQGVEPEFKPQYWKKKKKTILVGSAKIAQSPKVIELRAFILI